jgi:serpin B
MQRNDHGGDRSGGGAIGAAAAMLAAALVLAGCGGGGSGSVAKAAPSDLAAPAVLQARAAGTPVSPAIVAADNGLGLTLLNTLIPGANGGNIALSPLSVALALQVLYNGAAGSTQQAMAQTLELGALDLLQLNGDNAALQASLIDPDPEVELTIANSLWIDQATYPVEPQFIQSDENYYAATVGDLAGAPANVNAWVDAETHGLIPEILPPDLPPSEFRVAIIANALYFKGAWTTAFDPAQTAAAPFTLTDGTQVSVPMMRETGSFAYVDGIRQGTAFQAIRIPYGQGRMSFLVVLPAAGTSLAGFASGIDAATLAGWNAELEPTEVALGLPRFSATYQASLKAALSSLGMGVAFTPQADFSALAARALVSDVVHATKIEVDESGTVAAAATVVTVTTSIAGPVPQPMVIDHPFLYAIEDDRTGELLFVGLMMNPLEP